VQVGNAGRLCSSVHQADHKTLICFAEIGGRDAGFEAWRHTGRTWIDGADLDRRNLAVDVKGALKAHRFSHFTLGDPEQGNGASRDVVQVREATGNQNLPIRVDETQGFKFGVPAWLISQIGDADRIVEDILGLS